jgi:SAM-dependent methyltransferase
VLNKWYETFFQGVALDLWRACTTPDLTRTEADFLAETLNLTPGARVLDVPCGNGRHAIELASRGYHLTGVDLSTEFLAEARQSSLPIEWRLADMRDLPWESAFDAAYCWGNSFGYLDHAEMPDFCRALARVLKPGARLVIETGVAAEAILPNLQHRRWFQLGDLYLLHETQYHAQESRLQSNYTFIRIGKVENDTAYYAVFTIAEIRRMLAAAGLAVEALWSSTERKPFQFGDDRLVILGRRQNSG